MKYNPKINEEMASAYASQNSSLSTGRFCQGALQLMYELADYLAEIAGMTGLPYNLLPVLMVINRDEGIKAYHEFKGKSAYKVIVPDSIRY